MNQSRYSVNAAIVAYNRPDSLVALVESLLDQTRRLNKIIIIDNSTNDSVKSALVPFGQKITYRKMDKNVGSAGGFYHAIGSARANCDFVWIFDDDMNVKADALDRLLEAYETLKNDNKCGVLRCWFNHGRESNPQRMEAFAWRGTMIKSSVIEKIGLPDQSYFLYSEDVDYAVRIRKAGYHMYYVPASVMWINSEPTKHTFSFAGISISFHDSPFRLYYAIRNEILFCKKHHILNRLIKVILYSGKISAFIILYLRTERFAYLKAVASGIYHGLLGKKGINIEYQNP